MKNIYTLEDLIFLSEKALSFKGKKVSITKINGKVIKGKINYVEGSSNFPYLPSGLILDGNQTIKFGSIKKMEIIINEDKNYKDENSNE